MGTTTSSVLLLKEALALSVFTRLECTTVVWLDWIYPRSGNCCGIGTTSSERQDALTAAKGGTGSLSSRA